MEYTAEKVIFLDVDGVLNDGNTPEGYILRLGHAHERGEDVPYLLSS